MDPTGDTLPRVVEDLARKFPDDVWMILPLGSSLSQRWQNITYRELGSAVDGMIVWINATLGDLVKSGGVVAYMGYLHSDQRRDCSACTDT